MDQDLLKLVRCPVTGSRLTFADDATIESMNGKINEGKLVNRAGHTVEAIIDSGLVNEDRSILFPIRRGITIMVADQAIPISSEQDSKS